MHKQIYTHGHTQRFSCIQIALLFGVRVTCQSYYIEIRYQTCTSPLHLSARYISYLVALETLRDDGRDMRWPPTSDDKQQLITNDHRDDDVIDYVITATTIGTSDEMACIKLS
ncbi:hypothetical protein HELRODRAFT_159926 [Helobdella robusta]|uniref:Uncharacterized protein n=1 Tax=Helobdella robusta TaxID=6412 RepID=T1EPK3_HELRO|nr:hypothetical protein HELRODRAFT_159926 [Helobdella robusta]ESO05849.1 hypothetical protein HELRODRAFT_159926 [Helobdella robusta]